SGNIRASVPLNCTVRCVAGSVNTTAMRPLALTSASTARDCARLTKMRMRSCPSQTRQPKPRVRLGRRAASQLPTLIDTSPPMNRASSSSMRTACGGFMDSGRRLCDRHGQIEPFLAGCGVRIRKQDAGVTFSSDDGPVGAGADGLARLQAIETLPVAGEDVVVVRLVDDFDNAHVLDPPRGFGRRVVDQPQMREGGANAVF